jgi:hypothetical protein
LPTKRGFDQDLASISGNESTNDYTDAYTLDEVGNRLTKTHDAGRDGSTDQTTTSSYTTHSGLDDLLTQETVTDSGGTVTS